MSDAGTDTTCCICDNDLRPHAPQTCLPCYTCTRSRIPEIGDLYAALPDCIGHLTGTWSNRSRVDGSRHHPIPGGDALVLLAGGGGNGVQPSRRGDRSHAADQWPTDPPSVAGELARWEDDWRTARRDSPAPNAPTVTTATRYLLTHLRWAATEHPAFDEFATDIDALHQRLSIVTGGDNKPVKSEAHCLTCHTRLVQHWTDTGLSDTHTCPTCKTTYTPGQYQQALKAHLTSKQQIRKAAG